MSNLNKMREIDNMNQYNKIKFLKTKLFNGKSLNCRKYTRTWR